MNEHLNCPNCNQPTPESLVDDIGRAYCKSCDLKFFCMTVTNAIQLTTEEQALQEFSESIKVIPYIEIKSSKDLVKLKNYLSKDRDYGISELKEIIQKNDRKWELEEETLLTVRRIVIDLKVNYNINLRIKTLETD